MFGLIFFYISRVVTSYLELFFYTFTAHKYEQLSSDLRKYKFAYCVPNVSLTDITTPLQETRFFKLYALSEIIFSIRYCESNI